MQLMQKLKSLVVQKLDLNLKILRRENKADIKKQHDLYMNNLVGDVKANPRYLYRYINSQKQDTLGIPPLKKNGSGIAQSDFERAEEFNGQFSDVFTECEYNEVPLPDRSVPFMHDVVITKEGLTKLLRGLSPSKALGPDEHHHRVLKELAMELGPVFVFAGFAVACLGCTLQISINRSGETTVKLATQSRNLFLFQH